MKRALASIAVVMIAQSAIVRAAGSAESDCVELKRAVAAAGEKPNFRSMPNAELFTMMGFECEILDLGLDGRPALICVVRNPTASAWDELNQRITRCFPDAKRFDDPDRVNNLPPGRYSSFRIGKVRIDTDQQEARYGGLTFSIEGG